MLSAEPSQTGVPYVEVLSFRALAVSTEQEV